MLGLELGPVLGLYLSFVIFTSKKSADPHVRILPWPFSDAKLQETRGSVADSERW